MVTKRVVKRSCEICVFVTTNYKCHNKMSQQILPKMLSVITNVLLWNQDLEQFSMERGNKMGIFSYCCHWCDHKSWYHGCEKMLIEHEEYSKKQGTFYVSGENRVLVFLFVSDICKIIENSKWSSGSHLVCLINMNFS